MRNPAITILKAVAIILVVLAHSGSPTSVSHVAYMLCVSLFFVSAGYCFNPKYLNEPYTFVARRFKTIYVPFVVWSVFFLVLNHFWFATGILNEHFGNAQGGVTHPLNLHDGLQSLWSIVFNMSGYDQFLCGAYWFFRTLLVSSIAFLVLLKIVENLRWFRTRLALSSSVVAIAALSMALWQISDGLRVTGLAQGGYREFMAIFFLAAGFLFRRMDLWLEAQSSTESAKETPTITEIVEETDAAGVVTLSAEGVVTPGAESVTPRTKMAKAARKTGDFIGTFGASVVRLFGSTPLLSMPLALAILIAVLYMGTPSMGVSATKFSSPLLLALSGVAGFSLVYNISALLNRVPKLNKILGFIGENTLYVLLFHLLAFKLVSMLKVAVYHLPWEMIGGHPYVHNDKGEWFWILYTIVGVGLPLGIVWLVRYCNSHYNIDSYAEFARAAVRGSWKALRFCAKWTWHGLRVGSVCLWAGICWLTVTSWKRIYDFCIRFVDTVKAGYDVDQDKEDVDDDTDEEYDDEDDEDEEEEDDEDD